MSRMFRITFLITAVPGIQAVSSTTGFGGKPAGDVPVMITFRNSQEYGDSAAGPRIPPSDCSCTILPAQFIRGRTVQLAVEAVRSRSKGSARLQ